MKYNNLLATLITISFSCITVNAQNEATVPEPAQEDSKAAILNTRFSNLPLEQRQRYLELRAEAHRFFSNKRTFETLMALHEMRTIFDGDPLALNLLGAIYVEFRDFPKAREIFTNAIEIAGEDPKILFNLAELEFCDNRWSVSIERFSKLLIKIEGQSDTDFSRLIEFKIMLSYLALSQSDDTDVTEEKKKEYLAAANKFVNKYSYLVDSPFYYYSNAAMAFYKDDKTAGSNWIMTAKRVYLNTPGILTSWDDTMVEFGYIEAHYGKHHSISAEDPE